MPPWSEILTHKESSSVALFLNLMFPLMIISFTTVWFLWIIFVSLTCLLSSGHWSIFHFPVCDRQQCMNSWNSLHTGTRVGNANCIPQYHGSLFLPLIAADDKRGPNSHCWNAYPHCFYVVSHIPKQLAGNLKKENNVCLFSFSFTLPLQDQVFKN